MIRAVVFDLGEVLSSPPDLFARLAARMGVPVDELDRHYWTNRRAYDEGATLEEYWSPMLAGLGIDPDHVPLPELAELDSGTWVGIRDEALAILRDCHASGPIVAILSNSPHAIEPAIEGSAWRRHVDHVFVSATLGLMKPDEAIYRHVTQALGVAPGEIAFVDDKPENVAGARAIGWEAHLWVDDADTRAWLVDLGVVPAE